MANALVLTLNLSTLIIAHDYQGSDGQTQMDNYLSKTPPDLETDEFAEIYDELPLWSAPFATSMLQHIPMRAGIVAVDVGAGTGFLTVELAQRCGPNSQIIAVDPWQAATRRLSTKVKYHDLSNVRIISSAIEKAAIEPSSVDLIVSNLGLNNFENPVASLRACQRMAKEGADLILTTNTVGHMALFYSVFRSSLEESGLKHLIAKLDGHIKQRGTIDTLRTRLTDTGFQEVKIVEDASVLRFVDGTAFLRHHLIGMGFLPQWKQLVPKEHHSAVFSEIEERLNEIATRQGELSMTIPVVLAHFRKNAEAS